MNPTPDHPDDEILSALLDGDFVAEDGAGSTTAHVTACERCAGRQAELAAARVALATPLEPLDELTRRRLVAGALRVAGEVPAAAAITRSRWGQRHQVLIGSAAAVLLAVLVGVPFVVGQGDGSKDGNSLASAAAPDSARNELASPFLGDLGDLADRNGLRLRLSGAADETTSAYAPLEPGPSPAAGGSTGAPAPVAAPVSGGLASSPGAGRAVAPPSALGRAEKSAETPTADAVGGPDTFTSNQSAANQSAARNRADTDACVAALVDGPARGGRLTGSGTGTWEGRPAIVAAFELSGGTVAFVADRSGCAVLDRFAL